MKAKILIVEDEAIIAMEVESQLQSLGYEVTSIVDTGERAIKKAEEDKPDLILMDIRIKGEMDGIDTAELIRNKFGIPVIFSTAYLDHERIERSKITMPFGYVLKPIQERDLKVTLEMALYVAKVDSKRKKTEKELAENKKWLEEAQQLTHIGHWVWELDSKILFWSNEIYQIFGVAPDSFQPSAEAFENTIHPDDLAYFLKKRKIMLSSNQNTVIEHRIIRPNGQTRHVEERAVVALDEKNNATSILGTVQDITERKQAEEELQNTHITLEKRVEERTSEFAIINNQLQQELRVHQQTETKLKESEERFRDLFENAPLPYQSLDENGQIIEVNEAWLVELGYRKNEVIGKNIIEFLPDDFHSVFYDRFPLFKKNGYILNANFKLKCKDGTIKETSFNGKIGKDNSGNFKQTHCVFSPIIKLF